MKKMSSLIIWFSFVSVLIFFSTVFVYQLGDEYILSPLDSIAGNVSPSMGISSNIENHIHSLPIEYRNLNIPYDLGFLLSFLIVFITSIVSSYKSKEASWFSFFGTITLGFMILLFVTGFIITLKDWFVLNLIENVLGFELASTPIFYYYLNNVGMLNFLWFVILVIVNKLNFTLTRDSDEDDINIIGGNMEQ